LLEKCERLGFDAVEIIPFDPNGFPEARVKAAAADLGLTINTGYGMPDHFNTNVEVGAGDLLVASFLLLWMRFARAKYVQSQCGS
jgi:sugar phosphate isomerase/epimerase